MMNLKGITLDACVQELVTKRHGSFAHRLAMLWMVADSGNRAQIERSWPHVFEKAAYFVSTERSEA